MTDIPIANTNLAAELLRWFDEHGRHDLPWQSPRNAYRVWLSEIMLQQTQVTTVIPYFERFLVRFPDVATLAKAPVDDVLALWAGLGYYARARNLHRAAQQVMAEFGGEFPANAELLQQLPGIGRSTAGAIVAQAYGIREPILDGNVKRVLSRLYAVDGWPGKTAVANQLWERADQLTPQERPADYTQAIMDLGATLCTRSKPACLLCPWQPHCKASAEGRPTDYPTSKPKKARPQKALKMLLLMTAEGEVLLQRRPPTGIWGGLWSLPECAIESDARSVAADLGFAASEAQPLPEIQHAFSHYELTIHPQLMQVAGSSNLAKNSDQERWYPLLNGEKKCDEPATGLPAPIQKLFDRLAG